MKYPPEWMTGPDYKWGYDPVDSTIELELFVADMNLELPMSLAVIDFGIWDEDDDYGRSPDNPL